MATGFWVTQSIYVAARLGIADLLKDGPKTSDELARATNTNGPVLYRVLRALAGLGIFANGAEVFPYYAEHTESFEPFNEAMTNFSEAVIKAVVPAYDFSSIRKLVDIGGGHGSLLAAILKANPETRGVLFDLPTVVEGAKERLAAEGVSD